MRRLYIAAVAAVVLASSAFAQSPRKPPYSSPPTSYDVYGATGLDRVVTPTPMFDSRSCGSRTGAKADDASPLDSTASCSDETK